MALSNSPNSEQKPTASNATQVEHFEINNLETIRTADPMRPGLLPTERLPNSRSDITPEAASEIISNEDWKPELPSELSESGKRQYLMQRFTLYETATRFYLVGEDITGRQFRVLKIDRTVAPGQLGIFEDEIMYDKESIRELLAAIEDGNKGSGGFKQKFSGWGLLGFIRFTETYYMVLVTKRTQAAMIGGHYLYQVEATELVPLTTGSSSRFQKDRNPDEARYLGIFANIDLTKSFYYSYSYNVTQTLQSNILKAREAVRSQRFFVPRDWNDMFVWNHHLLKPAISALKHPYDWCIPVIYGYIDQAGMLLTKPKIYEY
jgi:hypothetical protein